MVDDSEVRVESTDHVEKMGSQVIDPRELNELLDLAARGGLGQAVAYVLSLSSPRALIILE